MRRSILFFTVISLFSPRMSPTTASVGRGMRVAPNALAAAARQGEVSSWNDHHVSWSPDGQHLAVDSDRSGSGEVWVLRVDGSEARRITSTPGEEVAPVWSPDGEWIAVQLEVEGEVDGWIMRPDGSGRRRISTGGIGAGRMSWAPAAEFLAVAEYVDRDPPDLHAVKLSSGERTLLVKDAVAPSWSPDGQYLTFTRRQGAGYDLFVRDLYSGAEVRLTETAAIDSGPAWSPDGQSVAFYSDRDGNREIYTVRADGTDLRRITETEANEVVPAWNPAGSRLAYQSNRNGTWEIFIMDLSSMTETQVTFGATGGRR